MTAPSPCSHSLPSVWSKCQWVLIKCVTGSELRLARACAIRGREAVIPASTSSLPSLRVSTAILPPEPLSTLTLPRSLWTLIGAVAASARIKSTIVRASAKTWLGDSQFPVAANVAEPRQQRQKLRRESERCRAKVTVFLLCGHWQNRPTFLFRGYRVHWKSLCSDCRRWRGFADVRRAISND